MQWFPLAHLLRPWNRLHRLVRRTSLVMTTVIRSPPVHRQKPRLLLAIAGSRSMASSHSSQRAVERPVARCLRKGASGNRIAPRINFRRSGDVQAGTKAGGGKNEGGKAGGMGEWRATRSLRARSQGPRRRPSRVVCIGSASRRRAGPTRRPVRAMGYVALFEIEVALNAPSLQRGDSAL